MLNFITNIISGVKEAVRLGNLVGRPVEMPVITSGYGNRVLNGVTQFHNGIDFVSGKDTTVYSVGEGVVVYDKDNYDDVRWKAMMMSNNITDWADSGGNMVIIKTQFPGKGEMFVRYLHLGQNQVSMGDAVHAGQPIGQYANVGYSYGAHLHLDIMKMDWSTFVDPKPYLASVGYNI